jgi:hypothetical protein
MPRFYFDYKTPKTSFVDHIGTQLPDHRAAKAEAVGVAAEWLKDHARAGSEVNVSVRNGKPTPEFVVTASIKVSDKSWSASPDDADWSPAGNSLIAMRRHAANDADNLFSSSIVGIRLQAFRRICLPPFRGPSDRGR